MTLEEAIKYCIETAEEEDRKIKRWNGDHPHLKKIDSCEKCSTEHRQLAEWLKELKVIHEIIDDMKDYEEIFVGYLRKKIMEIKK